MSGQNRKQAFDVLNEYFLHLDSNVAPVQDLDVHEIKEMLVIGAYCSGSVSLKDSAKLAGVEPRKILGSILLPDRQSLVETENDEARVFFSAVLPVLNESENLPSLMDRLVPILEGLGSYEIIFVNDGSTDSSSEIIRKAHESNENIKLVEFSRNFGHQAALTAGIKYSKGQVVCLMDADLQDPPEELPRFLEYWRAGNHVVYAIREKRKENIFKKSAYFIFYRLLNLVSSIPIPLDSGDFCLMDRKVVDELLALPEKGRFLRGLRSWVGFKQIGVSYERSSRYAGRPKYDLKKLLDLAVSGLISFTVLPLRIAAQIGILTATGGMLLLVVIILSKLLDFPAPAGWSSQVSLMLVLSGIQLTVMGVLGEYIGKIFEEIKGRPNFIVRESLGVEKSYLVSTKGRSI